MSGARGQYVPRSPNIAATPLRSEAERKMRCASTDSCTIICYACLSSSWCVEGSNITHLKYLL